LYWVGFGQKRWIIKEELSRLYMSPTTTACCAVLLNQQQQTNIHRCQQMADKASVTCDQTKPKYCTVVENGRVVVKPIKQD
jgi:hypothetical protein